MFYVVLLYALFASVFTITKHALENAAPVFLVGFRMLFAGAILLLYLRLVHPEKVRIPRSCWGKIFGLALFNIYLTNVLEFLGLQYLTSFKTCFIYSISPFLSALFSYVLLSEKVSFKKWIGLGVGILGMAPILFIDESQEAGLRHFFFFSWAELCVMGAATATVYGWILMRQVVKNHDVSPVAANGYSMLFGGLFSLIHSYSVEPWKPFPVQSYSDFLLCSLALMIISNLICYNLYGFLLKRYSAPFMSFSGYTTPFFAAFFGWFFLGETISLPFYISGAIVFLGLTVFYQEELREGLLVPDQTGQEIPSG